MHVLRKAAGEEWECRIHGDTEPTEEANNILEGAPSHMAAAPYTTKWEYPRV